MKGMLLSLILIASPLRAEIITTEAAGITTTEGYVVRDVAPGSRLYRMGVRDGDRLLRVGPIEIVSLDAVLRAASYLDKQRPSSQYTVQIRRGEIDKTLRSRPSRGRQSPDNELAASAHDSPE